MKKYSSGAGKFTKKVVDLLLARPRQNCHVKQFFSEIFIFSEKSKNLQIFSGDGPGAAIHRKNVFHVEHLGGIH